MNIQVPSTDYKMNDNTKRRVTNALEQFANLVQQWQPSTHAKLIEQCLANIELIIADEIEVVAEDQD